MHPKISFVIEPDGRATLYLDNDPCLYVGRHGGLDEVVAFFNKQMKERHLSYRLNVDFTDLANLI